MGPFVMQTKYLTSKEAADLLGIQEKTLKQWRSDNRPQNRINYIKISNKIIRYKLEDIQDFINKKYIQLS
jgi:predicted site-specific integrase-resolvase